MFYFFCLSFSRVLRLLFINSYLRIAAASRSAFTFYWLKNSSHRGLRLVRTFIHPPFFLSVTSFARRSIYPLAYDVSCSVCVKSDSLSSGCIVAIKLLIESFFRSDLAGKIIDEYLPLAAFRELASLNIPDSSLVCCGY